MKHEKVSLIMVVHEDPPYIFKALESALPLVSEIVLVDIGIDKNLKTKLKENKFGVPLRFVTVGEPVPYVELVREETKKEAQFDYILFLDEDEELSAGLVESLLHSIGKYDYFAFPRKNIIFGKWVENSRWWPDYQVRLFRKSKVIWPKIIHSQPQLTGNGLSLAQDERFALIHHNYNTIDQYLTKGMRYAKAQAKEKIAASKPYNIVEAFNESISEFISRFFSDKGYKDGLHGLVLATLQMFYTFLVFCYYFEYKKFEPIENIDVNRAAKDFFEHGAYETNHWLNKEGIQGGLSTIKSRIVNKLLK